MWTFLKLDTRTGRVWQVQYAINSSSRGQSQFVSVRLSLDEDWSALSNIGRFELYPTQNMYTFLLMDKIFISLSFILLKIVFCIEHFIACVLEFLRSFLRESASAFIF